jgi:hypothetical protein
MISFLFLLIWLLTAVAAIFATHGLTLKGSAGKDVVGYCHSLLICDALHYLLHHHADLLQRAEHSRIRDGNSQVQCALSAKNHSTKHTVLQLLPMQM